MGNLRVFETEKIEDVFRKRLLSAGCKEKVKDLGYESKEYLLSL